MDVDKREQLRKGFEEWYDKGWSDWLILNRNNVENLPEFPGVYEIRIKNREFERLKGTTKTIYVGCTEKRGLKKRLRGLINGKHIAKERITAIAKELNVELELRFKVDFGARKIEAKLLRDFQDKHLELPPCNRNITKN